MVKAALLWLVSGVALGGLMLVDRGIPGNWRLWTMPTHGHMLFVGWLVQFALGIAYWLLPRKRSPELPTGYRERPALVAVGLLNLGLALRVVGEPMERTGHAGAFSFAMLAGSSLFQVVAIVIFVMQLWPRIYGKGKLGKPASGPSRNTVQRADP
jgi:hypothetical protein